jgi:CDP-glucose 4,6-dehydratase
VEKKETGILMLDCRKARDVLQWRPKWDFKTTVAETMKWYLAFDQNASTVSDLTLKQIMDYSDS